MAVLIAVVGGFLYFRDRVDEEIRCRIEQQIAEQYPDLLVTVHSAELVDGEGIKVRGLLIVEPGAEGPRSELLQIDELMLHCATDMQDLIVGEPQITRAILRRPTLWATRRRDGTWSTTMLLQMPKCGGQSPSVTVQNGTIELFDPLRSPSRTLTLRNVNLTLSSPEAGGDSPEAGVHKLAGTFSADHLRGGEIEGRIDKQGGTWTVGGMIEGLDVSPEMHDSLPEPLAEHLAVLGQLRGQAALRFDVGSDPSEPSGYRFEASATLEGGRIADPRLPDPLTDIHASVRAGSWGFAVEELTARSGPATIWLAARQDGLKFGKSPLAITARVRELELGAGWRDRLPESLRQQWDKYEPTGRINADLTLSFDADGQLLQPDLVVECLDVGFTYKKYPYALEHAKGKVRWKDDLLQLHLTAFSGTRPVQLDAEIFRPTAGPTAWTGHFEARSTDLPIDEKLLSALTAKSQPFIRSLNPRGTLKSVYIRTRRDQPEGTLHKDSVIEVKNCSVRYDKFPYPFHNVCGTLAMRDDHWEFRNLEGTNDTGRIKCNGTMTSPRHGSEVFLRFAATDVPLEQELHDAMSPNVRRAWDSLNPHGVVDATAEVRYLPGTKKLDVTLHAEPKGDTTSIEPVQFPYRMEKLHGAMDYRNGCVTFERIRAEHAGVRLATAGHCNLLSDGRWAMHLKGLSVDRLRLEDRDLIRALPERLKKALVELQSTGPVNLHGSLDLESGAGLGDPVRSWWNVAIGFHQGGMDCGIPLRNVNGSMTLVGGFDGRRFHSRGELAIDSLTYKDFQVTQLKGPIWIDDQQVLLGHWVAKHHPDRSRQGGTQPRSLEGRLFGGTVRSDAWVSLGERPRYGVHAELRKADLSQAAQEVIAGRQNLRGKLAAVVDLGGTGRTLNGMTGRGAIRLSQGDIYELPVMISLLKILNFQPPDQTAFSTSDGEFRIEGGHVYFDRLDFNGDAISLLGRGEIDFESNIAMVFHAVVGRDDLQIPVISELMGGAAEQIMRIHVGGTLQNPDTRTEAFPGVNQALQQLQDDLQNRRDQQRVFPQARQWMPNVSGKGMFRR
ncbi:MAG: AsmA-like C-terminal region-containing protein [Candidatus Nealsonbacteria bacterium]|nr:AsmA-like C-terminal region-containing protein [Candidatus Nealsonbacteria bacterium]